MLTPVVDVLVERDYVDAGALLAYAISLAAPGAGVEHRFVAAVPDGRVVDPIGVKAPAIGFRMRGNIVGERAAWGGDRRGREAGRVREHALAPAPWRIP